MWPFDQNTILDMSVMSFLKCLEYKLHETDGPQGLRLGQWFGINTTLMCLQLMGIYPKTKLAFSSSKSLPASSSKPCCSMMGIIPSMPGDL